MRSLKKWKASVLCSICHLELENTCILRFWRHTANLPTKVFVSSYISTNSVMVPVSCHPQNAGDWHCFLITASDLCRGTQRNCQVFPVQKASCLCCANSWKRSLRRQSQQYLPNIWFKMAGQGSKEPRIPAAWERHRKQLFQCLLLISKREEFFWLSRKIKVPKISKIVAEIQIINAWLREESVSQKTESKSSPNVPAS